MQEAGPRQLRATRRAAYREAVGAGVDHDGVEGWGSPMSEP